jgi:hypothetical protein
LKLLRKAKKIMKSFGAYLQSMNRNFVWGIGIAILMLSSVTSFAQYRGEEQRDDQRNDQGNYEGTANAVSAGGNWTEYSGEDLMTAAKRVRFELPANDSPNNDDRAKVILYCTDGKLKLADFRPETRLGRPNWPGFWGQPQMRVLVRVDNAHSYHNWNWVNGHFLAMDKGTARELIGAHLFRIEFQTPRGPQIAEFSPEGLDLKSVSKACGLTPKKP